MKNAMLWTVGLVVAALLVGCSGRRIAPSAAAEGEPLALQMLRTEAQLSRYPFFTLLSFEHDTDAVFTRSEGATATIDGARAHTGGRSLRLAPGTRGFTINLASLHSGREWPGPWTLVGAYFLAEQATRLTAVYESGGKAVASYTVETPAGQWTPVLLDLASVLDGKRESTAGTLRFTFGAGLKSAIWCDDVIELNNATVIVGGSAGDGWTIVERGFRYQIDRPGVFRLTLQTPESSPEGWVLAEANEIRARFASRDGKRQMMVYADGRQFVNGQLRLLSPSLAAGMEQQHVKPAALAVAPDMGRVNRNSPGDADNDGYAESVGVYRVIASGPRLELSITPGTPQLVAPVIEVSGLPAGKILATMEGRLVDKVVRLKEGLVLIQLPGALDRKTTVNVRVGG